MPTFADWIDRHANARVVLLGEASHGTAEFYRARTRLTQRAHCRSWLQRGRGVEAGLAGCRGPSTGYVRHRSAPCQRPPVRTSRASRRAGCRAEHRSRGVCRSGCANSTFGSPAAERAGFFGLDDLQPVGVHGGRAVLIWNA
ncbi:hypothetical protein ACTMU2_12375 [Cupriavidus basilensis]